jgi:hypothetical protein
MLSLRFKILPTTEPVNHPGFHQHSCSPLSKVSGYLDRTAMPSGIEKNKKNNSIFEICLY